MVPGMVLAAALGGCGMLGKTSSSSSEGLGEVDGAFHAAYYKAQVAKVKGDQSGAREALLACLDADPESAVVHFELARIERLQGQWTAAMSAVERAVALDDNNPWYYREFAEIALELGRNDEADAALEWLLIHKPEDDVAAMMLLDLRSAEGRYEEAAEVVDVLEKEWGPDPEWHSERHRLHLASGDIEAAIEDLVNLERDFPELVEAPLQRARILTSLGREAEAEDVLRSALNRTGNGRLHLEWAHLLTTKGETEAARVHVRSAFASDDVPLAEKADIAWTYIELAELQTDLQPEAQQLVGPCCSRPTPTPLQPFELQAALYDIQGRPLDALEALGECLGPRPKFGGPLAGGLSIGHRRPGVVPPRRFCSVRWWTVPQPSGLSLFPRHGFHGARR